MLAIEPVSDAEYSIARFRVPGTMEVPIKKGLDTFMLYWRFTNPKRMSGSSSVYRQRLKYATLEEKFRKDIHFRKINVIVLPKEQKGHEPEWLKNVLKGLEDDWDFQQRGARWLWEEPQIQYVEISHTRLPDEFLEQMKSSAIERAFRRILWILEHWPYGWPDEQLQVWMLDPSADGGAGLAALRGKDRERATTKASRFQDARKVEEERLRLALAGDVEAAKKLGRSGRQELAYKQQEQAVIAGWAKMVQIGMEPRSKVPSRYKEEVDAILDASTTRSATHRAVGKAKGPKRENHKNRKKPTRRRVT